MARFPEADQRLFTNVFVCMRCNGKNRGSPGKKPLSCRHCGSKRLRLKHKTKKA
ncbi:MAG: 50S ribosomal protein L40e [Candidatus Diapherotrites archaeon]|uniref:50S ribosomal protein L40e n=1 Tax=Candidatus Iainarchaeum sp. TaxID=3101447 RepID=A0A8T4L302_9ARCH|nr:50S ribosomal protein L40e [Candidatus Diapherotrites archaeon]